MNLHEYITVKCHGCLEDFEIVYGEDQELCPYCLKEQYRLRLRTFNVFRSHRSCDIENISGPSLQTLYTAEERQFFLGRLTEIRKNRGIPDTPWEFSVDGAGEPEEMHTVYSVTEENKVITEVKPKKSGVFSICRKRFTYKNFGKDKC